MKGVYKKVTLRNGKRKVYTVEKYCFIRIAKSVGVITAAIWIVFLFCGAVTDKCHISPILSITSFVTSAIVVIVFGTYILSNYSQDHEKRKGKKK